MVHKINMIDIYSNSWGPGDMGWQVEGPGVLTSRAIELGIQQVFIVKCLKGVQQTLDLHGY